MLKTIKQLWDFSWKTELSPWKCQYGKINKQRFVTKNLKITKKTLVAGIKKQRNREVAWKIGCIDNK